MITFPWTILQSHIFESMSIVKEVYVFFWRDKS